MKKPAVLLMLAALLIFGGCTHLHISENESTSQYQGESTAVAVNVTDMNDAAVTEAVSTEAAVITATLPQETIEETTIQENTMQETTMQPPSEETATVIAETTEAYVTENSAAVTETTVREETSFSTEPASTEEAVSSSEYVTVMATEADTSIAEQPTGAVPESTDAVNEATTEEINTAQETSAEIELSISMPEKNGTMITDKSPDNKFIKIVNKEKGIAPELLLAVYSVPESGQNYVFEFYEGKECNAENIRRVYLIDMFGDITSVAAAENSERENISPVENWFCMNVLIKEIIYPAVSAEAE